MSKKLYDENGNVVKGAKVKEPFYKRWWFILLVVLFIINAIGGGDDEESLETNEAETEEVVEETEPEEIEQESEEIEEVVEEVVEEEVEEEEIIEEDEPEEEVETELSREDRVSVAYVMMADAFSSTAEVDYDASIDALTLLPTDEQFTLEIVYMMMGREENIKSWNALVESLAELSISVSGIVDEDIKIAILNPEDSERVLLVVQNGFVLYNFANDVVEETI